MPSAGEKGTLSSSWKGQTLNSEAWLKLHATARCCARVIAKLQNSEVSLKQARIFDLCTGNVIDLNGLNQCNLRTCLTPHFLRGASSPQNATGMASDGFALTHSRSGCSRNRSSAETWRYACSYGHEFGLHALPLSHGQRSRNVPNPLGSMARRDAQPIPSH